MRRSVLETLNKIHTITADNGKEFARHKEIAKGLDAEFYFARPYHSWERGANENTNGLIRQYIPKGTDFSELGNLTTGPVSHSVTGHRWNIVNNYLTLTFEVCCTSN